MREDGTKAEVDGKKEDGKRMIGSGESGSTLSRWGQ